MSSINISKRLGGLKSGDPTFCCAYRAPSLLRNDMYRHDTRGCGICRDARHRPGTCDDRLLRAQRKQLCYQTTRCKDNQDIYVCVLLVFPLLPVCAVPGAACRVDSSGSR